MASSLGFSRPTNDRILVVFDILAREIDEHCLRSLLRHRKLCKHGKSNQVSFRPDKRIPIHVMRSVIFEPASLGLFLYEVGLEILQAISQQSFSQMLDSYIKHQTYRRRHAE